MHAQSLGRVRLFVTLWTAAHQAPLSMGFFRQEYWSGLPFPSPPPGDLSNPGVETVSCTMSRTSVHGSSGTLSIRSRPLNLFLTSTV